MNNLFRDIEFLVKSFPELQELSIYDCEKVVNPVVSHPTLKVLFLMFFNIFSQELTIFNDDALVSPSINCPKLEKYSLTWSDDGKPEAFCQMFKNILNFQGILDFEKGFLTSNDIESIILHCKNASDIRISDEIELKELNIHHDTASELSVTSKTLKTLSLRLPNLKKVSLDGANNKFKLSERVCLSVYECPSVESVSFGYVDISDKFMSELATFCPKIDDLYVDNATLTKFSANFASMNKMFLSECKSLTEITMDAPVLTDLMISDCPKLKANMLSGVSAPKLEKLDISGTPHGISDELFKAISDKFPTLTRLDLCGGTSLKASDHSHLQLPNLTELYLSENPIDDTSLSTLLQHLPALTKLDCTECQKVVSVTLDTTSLTDLSFSSCENLVSVNGHCPNLKVLEFSDCEKIQEKTFGTDLNPKTLTFE
jgi:hypothetical protein